ncbi:MAG: alpha/beta hydrolase [Planctomycetaceae bacterium]|nr:alpha/beta hydrolase [Planctomycetaceae bacterium]
MTSIWTEFFKQKLDWDLTGNGVNHPNDFGHRIYAQVLSTLLVPPTPSDSTAKTSPAPQVVSLWNDKAPIGNDQFEKADVKITVHQPAKGNGAAIVICPGGGYQRLVTGGEGHGIAKWLNQHGITGVVLEYRMPDGRSFVPLLDAQQAIRTVRANAKQWNIDPAKVGIMGFSAGGHLASTAATHFDAGDSKSDDPVKRQSSRPDFAILVYPVVTMGATTHGGSKKNLLGADPSPELIELFSNEKQVTAQTPPIFLAHALDDKPVPPENSRALYQALQAKNIPSKYLELPSGGHGLNGYKGPMWDAWQKQSMEWLAKLKFIPAQDLKD